MKKINTIIIILSCLPLLAGEDYLIYKQGKKAWSGEKWESASTYFVRVIEDYPESHFFKNSLYFLGNCEYHQKQFEGAFDHLSEYLETSGYPSAYQDAETLRLKCAFELAKTKNSMKKVLRESLNQKDVELVILSASLLLELDEHDIFEPLFTQLEKTGSPRLRQKIINFIEDHGDIEDRRMLRPYSSLGKTQVTIGKSKMLHLIVQESDKDILNICIPLSFAEYIGDLLSEEQIILIEKETKKDLKNLIKKVKLLSGGEILIKIDNHDGSSIKLVID